MIVRFVPHNPSPHQSDPLPDYLLSFGGLWDDPQNESSRIQVGDLDRLVQEAADRQGQSGRRLLRARIMQMTMNQST
jgi:hypothetical protein